ncbi:MAG: hypothetical protein M3081_17225 [Gemmatimonadota bacterium]|nr:hypothetical protein [Gemmatimonadota bacterium]
MMRPLPVLAISLRLFASRAAAARTPAAPKPLPSLGLADAERRLSSGGAR